eukprot:1567657-Pleurochrysis_carterae.AAC.1
MGQNWGSQLAFRMHARKRENPVTGNPSDMKWICSGHPAKRPHPGDMRSLSRCSIATTSLCRRRLDVVPSSEISLVSSVCNARRQGTHWFLGRNGVGTLTYECLCGNVCSTRTMLL